LLSVKRLEQKKKIAFKKGKPYLKKENRILKKKSHPMMSMSSFG